MSRTKGKFKTIALLLFILVFSLSACKDSSGTDIVVEKSRVNLIYPRDGSGGIQRMMTEIEDLRGDLIINAVEVAGDRDGYFRAYTAMLAALQRQPDLLIVHDTWLAELAAKGLLMKLGDQELAELENYYFPGMVDAVTWQGDKYGIPLWQDMPLLYYRTDLLDSSPNSLNQLAKTAWEGINNYSLSYGLIFPANNLHTRASFMASLLISYNALPDFSKEPIVYNEANLLAALKLLTSMIEEGTLSKDVLSMSIDDTRTVFESGNSLFMLNWSYASRLIDRPESLLVGRAGTCPIPMASEDLDQAGLSSGWVMATSSQTIQETGVKAIIGYLSANNNQRRMAMESGQMPARAILYEDKSWQEAINISSTLSTLMKTGQPLKTGIRPENWTYLLSDLLVRAFNDASAEDLFNYFTSQIEPGPDSQG